MAARTMAFANQKGGVGKTTTAVNVAAGLARAGKRVLLIDLDAQANATAALGQPIEGLELTVKDVLVEPLLGPKDAIIACREFDLIPSDNSLKEIESALLSAPDGRLRLKHKIKTIADIYDCILVDCPPSVSVLTQNALVFSREVYVPVDVGFFSMVGLKELLEDIEAVKTTYNPKLELAGIICTKYDRRNTLSEQVWKTLNNSFGEKVCFSVIGINVDLIRAQIERKSIFAFSASSQGAYDYRALVKEILSK